MNILLLVIGVLVGGIVAFLVQKYLLDQSYSKALFDKENLLKDAKSNASKLLDDAKRESESLLSDTKKELQSQKR